MRVIALLARKLETMRAFGAINEAYGGLPSSCVKPCVRRQKNDAADEETICDAVSRDPALLLM